MFVIQNLPTIQANAASRFLRNMKEAETKRAPKLTVEQKKYLENGIINKCKLTDIAKILGISDDRVRQYKSRNIVTIGLPAAPVISVSDYCIVYFIV